MINAFKYKLIGDKPIVKLEEILKQQGVENVKDFLNPPIDCLENPNNFDNIEKASQLFNKNKKRNVSLVVDCDVDGFTSAALIYQYLMRCEFVNDIAVYCHSAKQHGVSDLHYALSKDESDLIIIPDAGSSDDEYFNQIHQTSCVKKDILVLDHHLRDKKLPKECTTAIIVNNQMSDKINNKTLTGVGIVYKFCKYLDKKQNTNYSDDYLDLVALGMVADRADLKNLESRYLVLQGLSQINHHKNKNLFINELIKSKKFSIGNEVTILDLGFQIAPMINSTIRCGVMQENNAMFQAFVNSEQTMRMYLRGKGEVKMSMQEYARRICETLVRKQKAKIAKYSVDIIKQINESDIKNYPVIIADVKNVENTFTGLLANMLASEYKRPVLCMRANKGILRGSGRGFEKGSINDFNQFLTDTQLFSMVEGHPNSFGVSIDIDNLDIFLDKLSQMEYNPDTYYHIYNIFDDSLSQTTVRHFGKYHKVYGNGVDEPLFVVKGIICNKYNIKISPSQKAISFKWHNIEFVKYSRSPMTNLIDELAAYFESGNGNIEIEVVGKFKLGSYKDNAMMIVDDINIKPTDKCRLFGG